MAEVRPRRAAASRANRRKINWSHSSLHALLLLLLSSLIVLCQAAGPFYLSTSGSDSNNGGSLIKAWLTFSHACQQAGGGATVYIQPGIYPLTGSCVVDAHGANFVGSSPDSSAVVIDMTSAATISIANANSGASFSFENLTLTASGLSLPMLQLSKNPTSISTSLQRVVISATSSQAMSLSKGGPLSLTEVSLSGNGNNSAVDFISLTSSSLTFDSCTLRNISEYSNGVVSIYSPISSTLPSAVTMLSTLFAETTSVMGTVLAYPSTSLTISDSTFSDCTSAVFGNVSSSVSIETTTFDSNVPSLDSGLSAALALLSPAHVVNSTFTNNYNPFSNGSAIAANGTAASSGSLIVTDTVFYNNTGLNGGAIWIYGMAANLSGNTLSNNSASDGGAVYLENPTSSTSTLSVSLAGNTLSSNQLPEVGNGAALFATGSLNVALSNNTLEENWLRKGGAGAALYVNGSAYLSLANNIIASNIITGDGMGAGVFAADLSGLLVTNCTFSSNVITLVAYGTGLYLSEVANATLVSNIFWNQTSAAENYGAGVYSAGSSSPSTLSLSGNAFTSNRALRGGAAFLTNTTFITLLANQFINNSAQVAGGALSITNAISVSLSQGNTFENNSVQGLTGTLGGAAVFAGDISSLLLSGSTFSANGVFNEGSGGALYATGIAQLGFLGETYDANFASACGGAVYVTSSSSLNFITSSFSNNTISLTSSGSSSATFVGGAAICVATANATLVYDSSFSGNNAPSGAGGAILSNSITNLTVSASIFEHNKAAECGAALFASAINYLAVSDNLFEYNSILASGAIGGGAIAVTESTTTEILENQLFNNYVSNGGSGGAIFAISVSNLTLQSNTISNNTASAYNSTAIQQCAGAGLFSSSCASVLLISNTFSGNIAEGTSFGGAGACIIQATNANLQGNEILENVLSDGSGAGIYVNGTSAISLAGNIITNNVVQGFGMGAGAFASGSTLDATGNIFLNNFLHSGSGAGLCMEVQNSTLSNNSFTSNLAAQGSGGGIYCSGGANSAIALFNNTFINNTATTGSGGAGYIAFSASSTSSYGNLFENNTADAGGGLFVSASSANFSLASTSFSANVAHLSGGALYLETASIVALSSLIVKESSAGASGGGIYVDNVASFAVDLSSLTSNDAAASGGALFVNSATVVSISNTDASSNAASSSGGAVMLQSVGSVTMASSTHSENEAGVSGGAFWAESASSIVISNVSFERNKALESGGAMGTQNCQVISVASSLFAHNLASIFGGALYSSALNATTLSSNQFINNSVIGSADGGGGAVYGEPVVASLSNNTFLANSAQTGSSGGALFFTAGQSTLEYVELWNNTFANNEADNGVAGASFIKGSTSLNLTSNVFDTNSALDAGGALFLSNMKTFALNGDQFMSNSLATNASDAQGAALSLQNISSVFIASANLSGHYLMHGGFGAGLFASEVANLTVTGSSFTNNSVAEFGSGAAIYSDQVPFVVISTSDFGSNFLLGAAEHGILSVWSATNLTVTGSTFVENVAAAGPGAAIFSSSSLNIILQDNVITNNAITGDGMGAGVYAVNSTAIVANRNIFKNNAIWGSGSGSGLYLSAALDLSLGHNSFSSNVAGQDGNGGALCYENCLNCSVTFSFNSFNNNSAPSALGGAAFVNGTQILSMDSNIFSNNSAIDAGAVYLTSANSLVVTNGTFQNNIASSSSNLGGGSLLLTLIGSASMSGSTWLNNAASQGGALSAIGVGSLTLTNNTLQNNLASNATGNGGGLYASGVSTVTLFQNAISQNLANGDGGGVFISNAASAVLQVNTFSHNGALLGGALSVNGAAGSLDLTNNTIVGNSATGSVGGGGIYTLGLTLVSATSNVIKHNSAAGLGGGVFMANATIALLQGNSFSNNSAVSSGGALGLSSLTSVTLTGTNAFNNNTAAASDGFGGAALFATGLSNLSMSGSSFFHNYVTNGGSGGAVYASFITMLSATGVSFVQNSAPSAGGALYASATQQLSLVSNTFFQNSLISPSSLGGGAIYTDQTGTFAISGSNFSSNSASLGGSGGALYTSSVSNLNIQSTYFQQNVAKDQGGALYTTAGVSLSFSSCTFVNNSALNFDGGALAINAISQVSGSNSTFTSNQASNGGAVSVSNSPSLVLHSLLLQSNKASLYGGALYSNNLTAGLVTDSSFSTNSADQGGALSALQTSIMTLTNSNFTSNSARIGGGLQLLNSANLTLIDSNWTQNKAKLSGGALYVNSSSYFGVFGGQFDGNLVDGSLATGGAVYLAQVSNTTISGSGFVNNSASATAGVGGALYGVSLGSVSLNNINVVNNRAAAAGGAFFMGASDSVSVASSLLLNNSILGSSSNTVSGGGAIFLTQVSSSLMTGNTLSSNTAGNGSSGGALFASTIVDLYLQTNTFSNNIIEMGGSGAAIYATLITTLTAQGNTIFGNNIANVSAQIDTTSSGGGLFAGGSASVTLTNNNIYSNNAAGTGGGVSLVRVSNIAFSQNSVSNNEASLVGGGVSIQSSSQVICSGNTMSGNMASNGAAIILQNVSQSTNLTDNTFSGNAVNGLSSAVSISNSNQPGPSQLILQDNTISSTVMLGEAPSIDSPYVATELALSDISNVLISGGVIDGQYPQMPSISLHALSNVSFSTGRLGAAPFIKSSVYVAVSNVTLNTDLSIAGSFINDVDPINWAPNSLVSQVNLNGHSLSINQGFDTRFFSVNFMSGAVIINSGAAVFCCNDLTPFGVDSSEVGTFFSDASLVAFSGALLQWSSSLVPVVFSGNANLTLLSSSTLYAVATDVGTSTLVVPFLNVENSSLIAADFIIEGNLEVSDASILEVFPAKWNNSFHPLTVTGDMSISESSVLINDTQALPPFSPWVSVPDDPYLIIDVKGTFFNNTVETISPYLIVYTTMIQNDSFYALPIRVRPVAVIDSLLGSIDLNFVIPTALAVAPDCRGLFDMQNNPGFDIPSLNCSQPSHTVVSVASARLPLNGTLIIIDPNNPYVETNYEMPIALPSLPVEPTAVIHGISSSLACGPATLDASMSTGLGSFPRNFSWDLLSTSDTVHAAALTSFLHNTQNAMVALPSNLITPGENYTISLVITNLFNLASQPAILIYTPTTNATALSELLPPLKIDGPVVRHYSDNVDLYVNALVDTATTCQWLSAMTTFQWYNVTFDGQTVVEEKLEVPSARSPSLFLPASFFGSNQSTIVLSLKASVDGVVSDSSAVSVTLNYEAPALSVVSTSRTAFTNESIELSVVTLSSASVTSITWSISSCSKSYLPNWYFAPAVGCVWWTGTAGPSLTTSGSSHVFPFNSTTGDAVSIARNKLPTGFYLVTVTATTGFETASIDVPFTIYPASSQLPMITILPPSVIAADFLSRLVIDTVVTTPHTNQQYSSGIDAEAVFHYQWSVLFGQLSIPSDRNHQSSLILPVYFLPPGQTIILQLAVYNKSNPSLVSTSTVQIPVASAPTGGIITMIPPTGISQTTTFNITTDYWTSSLPIANYIFSYKGSNGIEVFLAEVMNSNTISGVVLCLPANVTSGNVTVMVTAIDVFGGRNVASTTVPLIAADPAAGLGMDWMDELDLASNLTATIQFAVNTSNWKYCNALMNQASLLLTQVTNESIRQDLLTSLWSSFANLSRSSLPQTTENTGMVLSQLSNNIILLGINHGDQFDIILEFITSFIDSSDPTFGSASYYASIASQQFVHTIANLFSIQRAQQYAISSKSPSDIIRSHGRRVLTGLLLGEPQFNSSTTSVSIAAGYYQVNSSNPVIQGSDPTSAVVTFLASDLDTTSSHVGYNYAFYNGTHPFLAKDQPYGQVVELEMLTSGSSLRRVSANTTMLQVSLSSISVTFNVSAVPIVNQTVSTCATIGDESGEYSTTNCATSSDTSFSVTCTCSKWDGSPLALVFTPYPQKSKPVWISEVIAVVCALVGVTTVVALVCLSPRVRNKVLPYLRSQGTTLPGITRRTTARRSRALKPHVLDPQQVKAAHAAAADDAETTDAPALTERSEYVPMPRKKSTKKNIRLSTKASASALAAEAAKAEEEMTASTDVPTLGSKPSRRDLKVKSSKADLTAEPSKRRSVELKADKRKSVEVKASKRKFVITADDSATQQRASTPKMATPIAVSPMEAELERIDESESDQEKEIVETVEEPVTEEKKSPRPSAIPAALALKPKTSSRKLLKQEAPKTPPRIEIQEAEPSIVASPSRPIVPEHVPIAKAELSVIMVEAQNDPLYTDLIERIHGVLAFSETTSTHVAYPGAMVQRFTDKMLRETTFINDATRNELHEAVEACQKAMKDLHDVSPYKLLLRKWLRDLPHYFPKA